MNQLALKTSNPHWVAPISRANHSKGISRVEMMLAVDDRLTRMA